ncbi:MULTISPECIES: hypothetical protein [Bradyrhizobium]|uniref:Uncharacterized protein n=1 Tax=Bradyrhizobium canariense TaxID=255045 RepID=A0A1X3GJC9_9BRAD|nr:hypothetical protein [Bradyrhizobium canariense]OSI68932.1 hypothetical protein BSZ22_20130 [Bradyrhizobium canariense]OSI69603.1 hypothetical protein BSZ21_12855 [Bradyrhizobium canariense]OSI79355.1 hypothetical protein BSZ23_14810 [Bradyrhizobium canariense]OSI89648.1 hypothetical protein BSZ25_20590 [Bradyrhizobium canariense]OSI90974.1 hypothetical protein BSZ24_18615 [Bradyrhizobium canariense]
MAQIWMTYDELAELSGCTSAEARMRAIHLSLDRRKSRDGATRVKLDLALTAKYFASVRDADFDLDGAIEALQATHRQMAELLTPNQFLGQRRLA